jgi:hypoxanthine phosphoribosyltransferase
MKLSRTPLIRSDEISARIQELAAELRHDYADSDPVLLCVLKGAFLFTADLVRALEMPVRVEFCRVKSYTGTESEGKVEFLLKPSSPLEGRHVLVIEDILDTGRTARAVLAWLKSCETASARFCALLDKPSRRVEPIHADYVGFTIPDAFVVGYGLDHEEEFRHLPDIRVLEN